MNVAKVALILILLFLLIIILFALTGLAVTHPMAAVDRIVAWSIRLNRTINMMIREVFLSIRIWFQESF